MQACRHWSQHKKHQLPIKTTGIQRAGLTKLQRKALGCPWSHGLWLEVVRGYLKDYGFVQTEDESFAEIMARALGVGTDELRVQIATGGISSMLVDKFGCVAA
jgi:hypothetical protein